VCEDGWVGQYNYFSGYLSVGGDVILDVLIVYGQSSRTRRVGQWDETGVRVHV